MAAEYLKLFKYIEKKVQERVEVLAHSIQQRAQGSASCSAADFPMSQCPVFQFSKQAIAYLNKPSIYMGSYFMMEGGRRRTGTWEVTELQCTVIDNASQGVRRWQCSEEGKGNAMFSSIRDEVVGPLQSCIEEWT